MQVGKIARSFTADEAWRRKEGFASVLVHVGPFAEIGFDDRAFSIMEGD